MILFEIKSPRPVPEKDLEANLENSFGKISGSIPVPVSITLTVTLSSFFSEIMVIFPFPSFVDLHVLCLPLLSLHAFFLEDSVIA